jgi:transcriptional regulator GlxA family with amidase domain
MKFMSDLAHAASAANTASAAAVHKPCAPGGGIRALNGLRTRAGVELAIKQIHASPASDLSVATLAARACLSMWRFTVIFKGLTGESPHRYVTRVRVGHAQNLLRQGFTPVDAAQASGFYDQSHLSRSMKASCGMSPKQFQQQHTGDTSALFSSLSSASYT